MSCSGCSDCPEVKIKELKGEDGLTPYIGENGNWYIGDVDQGVSAGNELMVETTLNVEQIRSLGTSPYVFSAATIGTDANKIAYPIRAETVVDNDGVNFTGSPRIVIKEVTNASYNTLIKTLGLDEISIRDNFNYNQSYTAGNDFTIIATDAFGTPVDPAGGGENATIDIRIFYRIKNV